MKFLKNNIDNIISFIALGYCIYYGFFGPNKDSESFKNWENVSITLTILYALILYLFALFGEEFDQVKKIPKGMIILFLSAIFLITIPFTFAFLGEAFKSRIFAEIANIIDWQRTHKMWLLTITALLFLIIDILVERSNGEKRIKYHLNRKYSEMPVLLSFLILLGYSYYIGNDKISSCKVLDSFFAGTVAFQMLISNIIWMTNDDKFWKSIINND